MTTCQAPNCNFVAKKSTSSKLANQFTLASLLFILILMLYTRRRNFYRRVVLFLFQFIPSRRMFLVLVLRFRRERRNDRRVWVRPSCECLKVSKSLFLSISLAPVSSKSSAVVILIISRRENKTRGDLCNATRSFWRLKFVTEHLSYCNVMIGQSQVDLDRHWPINRTFKVVNSVGMKICERSLC